MFLLREEDRGKDKSSGVSRCTAGESWLALVSQDVREGQGVRTVSSRKEPQQKKLFPKGAGSHAVWKIPVQG